MEPITMLLAFLALKSMKGGAALAPSSAPSSSTNGHNGHMTNGAASSMVLLQSGKRYRFVGTLSSEAPTSAEVRELLKLVAATDVKIRTRPPASVSFVAKMPLDVPFTPGTCHPQAPWLTLQAVEELEPTAPPAKRRAAPPRKKRGR